MAVNVNVGGNTGPLERDVRAAMKRINRAGGLKVRVDDKGVTQPLGNMKRSADEFSKSLEASNARVLAFGASVGIINAVSNAFKGLVEQTIKVEKNLTDINVVMQLTSKQLDKFGGGLFKVAAETGAGFQAASEAATEFARQGLSVSETLKRTKDALILTRLTGMKATESVKSLTAAMNTFKGEVHDSTVLVSKFAAVDVKFAVSAEDFAQAIARAGASARDAGVDINELIGIVTAVQERTARGGAVIGNAFKTIFTRLRRGSTLNELEDIGIAVRDMKGSVLPAMKILTQLAQRYDTLTDSQKSYVSQNVAGVFQINMLKAAMADLGQANSVTAQATKIASNATDESSRKNEQLRSTMAALATETGVAIQELAKKIGDIALAPGINKILDGVKGVADWANNLLGDGEQEGNRFAKGLLAGVGNFLSGPGLVVITAVVAKLFVNATKYGVQSLQSLLGMNKAATARKHTEQAILQVMASNSALSKEMLRTDISREKKEQMILALIRQQTTEAQRLAAVSKQLTMPMIRAGVTPNLSMRRAEGFIPNYAADKSERQLAQQAGYSAGAVKQMNIPGVGDITYNTAESVRKFPGMTQPAIIPPANSKAAGAYDATFTEAHGFSPYAGHGYVPNYALPAMNLANLQKAAGGKGANVFTKGRTAGSMRINLNNVFPDRINKLGVLTGSGPESLVPVKYSQSLDTIPELRNRVLQVAKAKNIDASAAVKTMGVESTLATKGVYPLTDSDVNKASGGAGSWASALKSTTGLGSAMDALGQKISLKLFNGKGPPIQPGIALKHAMEEKSWQGYMLEAGVKSALRRKIDTGKEGQRAFDLDGNITKPMREFMDNKSFDALELKNTLSADVKGKSGNVSNKVFTKLGKVMGDAKLATAITPILNALGTKAYSKKKAQGFIPNYADPLSDAINREQGAGVPVSKIRVGSHRALKAASNPIGLGVTNTSDEPKGLKDIFGADGFVPNYANPAKFQKGDFAISGRNVKYQKKLAKEANKEMKKLIQKYKMGTINQQTLNTSIKDLAMKSKNQANVGDRVAKEQLNSIGSITKLTAWRNRMSQMYQKTSFSQGMQGGAGGGVGGALGRFQGGHNWMGRTMNGMGGMGAMMALSMGAGMMGADEDPTNVRKQEMAGAMSGAATGMAVGMMFGPLGMAAGALGGAFLGLKSGAEKAKKALEEKAAEEERKAVQVASTQGQAVSPFLQKNFTSGPMAYTETSSGKSHSIQLSREDLIGLRGAGGGNMTPGTTKEGNLIKKRLLANQASDAELKNAIDFIMKGGDDGKRSVFGGDNWIEQDRLGTSHKLFGVGDKPFEQALDYVHYDREGPSLNDSYFINNFQARRKLENKLRTERETKGLPQWMSGDNNFRDSVIRQTIRNRDQRVSTSFYDKDLTADELMAKEQNLSNTYIRNDKGDTVKPHIIPADFRNAIQDQLLAQQLTEVKRSLLLSSFENEDDDTVVKGFTQGLTSLNEDDKLHKVHVTDSAGKGRYVDSSTKDVTVSEARSVVKNAGGKEVNALAMGAIDTMISEGEKSDAQRDSALDQIQKRLAFKVIQLDADIAAGEREKNLKIKQLGEQAKVSSALKLYGNLMDERSKAELKHKLAMKKADDKLVSAKNKAADTIRKNVIGFMASDQGTGLGQEIRNVVNNNLLTIDTFSEPSATRPGGPTSTKRKMTPILSEDEFEMLKTDPDKFFSTVDPRKLLKIMKILNEETTLSEKAKQYIVAQGKEYEKLNKEAHNKYETTKKTADLNKEDNIVLADRVDILRRINHQLKLGSTGTSFVKEMSRIGGQNMELRRQGALASIGGGTAEQQYRAQVASSRSSHNRTMFNKQIDLQERHKTKLLADPAVKDLVEESKLSSDMNFKQMIEALRSFAETGEDKADTAMDVSTPKRFDPGGNPFSYMPSDWPLLPGEKPEEPEILAGLSTQGVQDEPASKLTEALDLAQRAYDSELKINSALEDQQKLREDLLRIQHEFVYGDDAFSNGMQMAFKDAHDSAAKFKYEIGQALPKAFASNMSEAIMQVTREGGSVGDAMRDAAIGFLDTMNQMFVEKMMNDMMASFYDEGDTEAQQAINATQELNTTNFKLTGSIDALAGQISDLAGAIRSMPASSPAAATASPSPQNFFSQPNKHSGLSPVDVNARFRGGPVGLNKGGQVPSMLTNGEFVMGRDAVSRFGQGGMAQLNKGKIPAYKEGGFAEGFGSSITSGLGAIGTGLIMQKMQKKATRNGPWQRPDDAFQKNRAWKRNNMSAYFMSNSSDVKNEANLAKQARAAREQAWIAKQNKKQALGRQVVSLIGNAAVSGLQSELSSKTGWGSKKGVSAFGRADNAIGYKKFGRKMQTWGRDFGPRGTYGEYGSRGGQKSISGDPRDTDHRWGMYTGGKITGPAGIDKVPAMLTEGEYVINANAARKIGVPTLEKMNRGKFNEGGLVGDTTKPGESSSAGGMTNNISINVNVEGGNAKDGSKSDDTASDSKSNMNNLSKKIKQQVVMVIKEENRPGGLLG